MSLQHVGREFKLCWKLEKNKGVGDCLLEVKNGDEDMFSSTKGDAMV